MIRLVGMHAMQAQCNHKMHRGGARPCRLILNCSIANVVAVAEIELVKWIVCGLLARYYDEHASIGKPSLWRFNRA